MRSAMSARTNPRLRVGLVGLGRWGKNYLRALRAHPGVELVGVCDTSPQSGLEGVGFTSRFEDLLESDVEGLVVATPDATHAPLALEALRHGKHVLVEKPLALRTEEACAIERAAEVRGLTVLVGHLPLYHPSIARLKRLVADGSLGERLRVHTTRTSRGALHSTGGALWALGPHEIAIALNLFGRVVEARRSGHHDPVTMSLVLEDEGRGTELSSYISRRADVSARRIEIEGLDGSAIVDEITGETTFRDGALTRRWNDADADPLRAQLEDFVSSIRRGHPPLGSVALAREVVSVLCRLESFEAPSAHHRAVAPSIVS